MKRQIVLILPAMVAVTAVVGCNSSQSSQQSSNSIAQQAAIAANSTPIDPATVASISGTVKFDGNAPEPKKIDMSQDPGCAGANQGEMLVVSGGRLANVFVYVKDGLGDRTFVPPATPVIIDQSGCRYHPHVVGAVTGQTIEIRNEDATTHNVHPMPTNNPSWNISETASSPAIQRSFANEEIMMEMKCNLHPWMRMYINVVKSPFFAVTDAEGKYEIKGLPPGDYTLAFVHERLGEHDEKVTLGFRQRKVVDESFSGSGM